MFINSTTEDAVRDLQQLIKDNLLSALNCRSCTWTNEAVTDLKLQSCKYEAEFCATFSLVLGKRISFVQDGNITQLFPFY